MSAFILHLQDASNYERLDQVGSFVGVDESGSFGIWPHHERFMTTLDFGLARFSDGGQNWEYLAIPGAVVYFDNNELYINTRRYYRAKDLQQINDVLQNQLAMEEHNLEKMHQSIHKMEEEIFKRLWKMHK